jgi:S-adenosylmethionine decarboxylase
MFVSENTFKEPARLVYQPGLHLLVEMKGIDPLLVNKSADTKSLIDELVEKHQLHSLGSVYHEFPGGGFTAVVCLTESHLSIHTWPEHGIVTADVFLSNYRHDNSEKCKSIMKAMLELYACSDYHLTEVYR